MLALLLALLVAPEPNGHAAAAEVRAAVRAAERDMTPDQGFAWRPLVRAGETVAAVEIWRKPGRPAMHPDDAEYATVVEGEGTLVMGGTLAEPATTRPDLVEGSRIDGGTARRLGPGDVLLIPAGVPHWFGVTGRQLVLLGTKIPVRR